jgi:hypothetical protein
MRMSVRAVLTLGVVLIASEAGATQCRVITRTTFIETVHPNGAISMGTASEGEKLIVINCAPEGTRIWCAIQETGHTVFTVRRFLEGDRLDPARSRIVNFSECLDAD